MGFFTMRFFLIRNKLRMTALRPIRNDNSSMIIKARNKP